VTEGHAQGGLEGVNQDTGQAKAGAQTVAALRAGDPSPIALAQSDAVARATFAILESIETGEPVALELPG
jgi:hypothetical protein